MMNTYFKEYVNECLKSTHYDIAFMSFYFCVHASFPIFHFISHHLILGFGICQDHSQTTCAASAQRQAETAD